MKVKLTLDFEGKIPKTRSYHSYREWDDITEEAAHRIFRAAVDAGTKEMVEYERKINE